MGPLREPFLKGLSRREGEAGLFEACDVKLGDSNGQRIKALEGLREGEQVVEDELLRKQM